MVMSEETLVWIPFLFHSAPRQVQGGSDTLALRGPLMWRKRNPFILLVGMQTSTAAMENSVEIP